MRDNNPVVGGDRANDTLRRAAVAAYCAAHNTPVEDLEVGDVPFIDDVEDAIRAALAVAVPVPDEEDREMIPCCEHCGCSTPRLGHDDTCAEGCNDAAVAGKNEKARR